MPFVDLEDEISQMFELLSGQTKGMIGHEGWHLVLDRDAMTERMRELRANPAYRSAENERERKRRRAISVDPGYRAKRAEAQREYVQNLGMEERQAFLERKRASAAKQRANPEYRAAENAKERERKRRKRLLAKSEQTQKGRLT